MRISIAVAGCLVVVMGTARAQDLAQVEPFIGETAVAVMRVDVAQADAASVVRLITGSDEIQEVETLTSHVGTFLEKLRGASATHVYAVYSLRDIGRETPYLLVPAADHAAAEGLATALLNGVASREQPGSIDGRREPSSADFFEVTEAVDAVVFCGSKSARRRMGTEATAERAGLARAMEVAGNTPVVLVYAPTADQQRVIHEMLPEFPAEMGGLSGEQLACLEWVAASETPDGRLHLEFETGAGSALPEILGALALLVPGSESESGNERGSVTWPVSEGDTGLTLRSIVSRGGALSNKFDSVQNLKQIALAMHNFHDAYDSFPPTASYDGDKPLLSWRVHLLPYLDAGGLYARFHLDEPWDSEHNRQLIPLMPDVFKSTDFTLNMQGLTRFVVPVGEMTVFHGQIGTQIKEIKDGTSNTIMALQATADHAVIWTKPDDLPIDMDDVTAGIVGPGERFNCVFCDGSAQRLPISISPATLKAILTRDGGEVYDWNTL